MINFSWIKCQAAERWWILSQNMEGEISELKALTRTGNASQIERSIIKIPPRHTRHSGPPEGQDASPRSRQWTRQQNETQDNRSVSQKRWEKNRTEPWDLVHSYSSVQEWRWKKTVSDMPRLKVDQLYLTPSKITVIVRTSARRVSPKLRLRYQK